MTKRALLVLDVVNEFVDPQGLYGATGYADCVARQYVLTYLNHAIGVAREAGDPVIFVRLACGASDVPAHMPYFAQGALVEGSWSAAIHDEVDYQAGQDLLLSRTSLSAFHGTGLAERLQQQDVHEVYIAGIATDGAVLATALTAFDLGLQTHVLHFACAAATGEGHLLALQLLRNFVFLTRLDDTSDQA